MVYFLSLDIKKQTDFERFIVCFSDNKEKLNDPLWINLDSIILQALNENLKKIFMRLLRIFLITK